VEHDRAAAVHARGSAAAAEDLPRRGALEENFECAQGRGDLQCGPRAATGPGSPGGVDLRHQYALRSPDDPAIITQYAAGAESVQQMPAIWSDDKSHTGGVRGSRASPPSGDRRDRLFCPRPRNVMAQAARRRAGPAVRSLAPPDRPGRRARTVSIVRRRCVAAARAWSSHGSAPAVGRPGRPEGGQRHAGRRLGAGGTGRWGVRAADPRLRREDHGRAGSRTSRRPTRRRRCLCSSALPNTTGRG
jgi:hypothetical protein